MSYNSGDDQSEDGELRQSPDGHRSKLEIMELSLSEEEVDDNMDSLDIKPPQAHSSTSSRSKRREHDTRSYHKRSERHRDERHHHHRDKERSVKEREHHKDRYYRERSSAQYYQESNRQRKHDKHQKHDDDKRIREKDLRERLLSRRPVREEEHREVREVKTYHEEIVDNVLSGEAGAYVKEIINLSTTEEKKHKKEEDKPSEEDRAEQEKRREKLIEAARIKEQSRMDREKRHQEKTKRKQEEQEEYYKKRLKSDIVLVSDNSEEEPELVEEEEEEDEDDKSEDDSTSRSEQSSASRTGSDSEHSRSPENGERKSPSPIPPILKAEEPIEEKKEDSKIDKALPPYYPAVQGCRSVEEFQCLNRIEEGTYGVVYRAKDKRTDGIVALKRLKMEKEKEGFPITSLREINTLLKGQHPNIVTVREIVVGSNMDKIFIVMDYVEHDLKSLMETMRHKKQNFTPGEVKCLLKQLLMAVAHLHDNWILHRDLKTSNLLLSHKGILKVGDFGLAREYGSPLKAYTSIVVTLWYRAPELLLGIKEYSTPIDMWSVGCIFAELLLMNALFPGKSEVDQLNRIFRDLGTPSEKIWPGFNKLPAVQKIKFSEYPVSNLRAKFQMLTEMGLGMLTRFLTFDPVQRVTAEDALKHSYFDEAPLPIDPAMFPTWPAKSELGQKRALAASPKPPSGGGEYKKLGGDGDEDGYGFRIGLGVDNRRMGGGFSLKF